MDVIEARSRDKAKSEVEAYAYEAEAKYNEAKAKAEAQLLTHINPLIYISTMFHLTSRQNWKLNVKNKLKKTGGQTVRGRDHNIEKTKATFFWPQGCNEDSKSLHLDNLSSNSNCSYPSVIEVSAIEAGIRQRKQRIAYVVDDFNVKLNLGMLPRN